jgi:hypothetical protein
LGWDQKNQFCIHPKGSAFGILDAWNAAVEEQGPKTLHSDWLLYVKQWSSLLHGLYSKDQWKHSRSANKLHNYVDNIIWTKLFGLEQNTANQAYCISSTSVLYFILLCRIFVKFEIWGICISNREKPVSSMIIFWCVASAKRCSHHKNWLKMWFRVGLGILAFGNIECVWL